MIGCSNKIRLVIKINNKHRFPRISANRQFLKMQNPYNNEIKMNLFHNKQIMYKINLRMIILKNFQISYL